MKEAMEPGESSHCEISPGMTKYWIPECQSDRKPAVGMVFTSLQHGIDFYNEYASLCGFDPRLHSQRKHKSGLILFKYVVCNRQGFKPDKVVQNEGTIPTVDDLFQNANLENTLDPCMDNSDIDDNVSLCVEDSDLTSPAPSNQCTLDDESNKRRRVSTRNGCKACVVFKYCGYGRYSVFKFEERHCHRMLEEMHKQFLKVNRNLDFGHKKFIINCAKANIGPMKSYKLFKESVGGYSNIGATAVDFKNFKRDLRAYIEGVDAQMLIDKLFRKVEVCSSFFFDYDVDENDQLTKIFWADPICRRNYSYFGDVVSFDATFRTNRYNLVFVPFTGVDNHKKCVTFAAGLLSKEDVESYVWLVSRFIDAMGSVPMCVITDQDPAMRIAIQKVIPNVKHRYCMWHIMNKLTTKVGPVLSKDVDFLTRINSVVWSNYLEPSVFEEKWKSVMTDYDLLEHQWFVDLFNLRKFWIPSYFRDLFMAGLLRTTSRSESENNFFGEFTNPHFSLIEFYMQFESAMDAQRHNNDKLNSSSDAYIPVFKTPLAIEKHASEMYTVTIFYLVQEEIASACFSCHVLNVHENEENVEYVIKDDHGMTFKVQFNVSDVKAFCECKYFLRMGLVCRHMFVAFKYLNLTTIPHHYVVSRWCKKRLLKPVHGIGDVVVQQCIEIEEKKKLLHHVWSDLHSCVALAEKDATRLKQFATVIRHQKNELMLADRTDSVPTTKDSMIQDFYGASTPAEVSVFPPQKAKNKGSGRRIKGAREASIEENKKPKRLCRSCNEMCNHDSRNCPLNKNK
ncbi:unnamed protein product [Cuscuta epithymum]|uniref:SWIM-type domain-containing protein n=2 Tax=Cuscuta epithymum TaxID=186058 RepID=A0AAV0E8D6_9ASTE|nr:unnamed protein product [Cuscuta epithymum]